MPDQEIQDQLANQPPILLNNIYQSLRPERTVRVIGGYERILPSKIFVHPGARSLHALQTFDIPTTLLFDKIGQTCNNLVHLSLTRFHNVPIPSTESVVKLLQNLPKLQHLKLWCTDEMAAAIGKICPLIKRLDVPDSSKLTDIGLRSLCCCVKLNSLNIKSTSTTAEGCLFVLNQQPVLEDFQHDHWHEICIALAKLSSGITYPSKSVTVRSIEHFPVLATNFPNVRNLTLKNVELLVSNIAIWPQRLKALHLEKVRLVNVNISHINRACPMLETLSLKDCTFFNDGKIIAKPLQNLRHLILTSENPVVTEKQMTTLLVQCKSLETLEFSICTSLSDDLILELAELNALRSLSLYNCPLITVDSIIKLLDSQNPMNYLEIGKCNSIIGSTDYVKINHHVKRKNLDLEFMPVWYAA